MSAEVTGESPQITIEFIAVEESATALQQEFKTSLVLKHWDLKYTGEYLCYRNQGDPTENVELLCMR